MIMKEYKTKKGLYNIEFDLQFRDNLTLIAGDSGKGKTLMFKGLQARSLLKDSNIICVDINRQNLGELKAIRDVSGKLIVIDNADIMLDDIDRYTITLNKNKNQYIILGRNPSGLGLTPTECALMKIRDDKVVLTYPFLGEC